MEDNRDQVDDISGEKRIKKRKKTCLQTEEAERY
jgi:hypothetical protein